MFKGQYSGEKKIDDPSSRLEGLEEDKEITADKPSHPHIHPQNCDFLSKPVPSGYGLREKYHRQANDQIDIIQCYCIDMGTSIQTQI